MADHPHHHNQDPNSQSWSQLLLGGLQDQEGDEEEEEDRWLVLNNNNDHHFQQPRNLENLEGRIFIPLSRFGVGGDHDHHHHHDDHDHDHEMKQEKITSKSKISLPFLWSSNNNEKESSSSSLATCSSPKSSTNNNNAILEFSFNDLPRHHSYYSSQCAVTGGTCKKARVQPVSGQPPTIKVRKEKVGDRITALHQLVSPFGKTDTASVLSEAIGYVRFLHSQIEALISPYLGNNSSKPTNKEHKLLLNDNSLKRKLPHSQENDEEGKELRSRGLCLVPVSCTQLVQSDINGADFWAQAYNANF